MKSRIEFFAQTTALLGAAFALSACQVSADSSGVHANANKNDESYSYSFESNGCKTEKQSFGSQQDMCDGLQDDSRNHGCALTLREDYFKQQCPGQNFKGSASAQPTLPPGVQTSTHSSVQNPLATSAISDDTQLSALTAVEIGRDPVNVSEKQIQDGSLVDFQISCVPTPESAVAGAFAQSGNAVLFLVAGSEMVREADENEDQNPYIHYRCKASSMNTPPQPSSPQDQSPAPVVAERKMTVGDVAFESVPYKPGLPHLMFIACLNSSDTVKDIFDSGVTLLPGASLVLARDLEPHSKVTIDSSNNSAPLVRVSCSLKSRGLSRAPDLK